jgi:hypothetical protein
LKKLKQVKLDKHLFKIKYDDIKDTYILEYRIKKPLNTNKKYIYNIYTSKDINILNDKLDILINNVKLEKNIDTFDLCLKKSYWNKYKVSTFYAS